MYIKRAFGLPFGSLVEVVFILKVNRKERGLTWLASSMGWFWFVGSDGGCCCLKQSQAYVHHGRLNLCFKLFYL